MFVFGGRDASTAPNLTVRPIPVSRLDLCFSEIQSFLPLLVTCFLDTAKSSVR